MYLFVSFLFIYLFIYLFIIGCGTKGKFLTQSAKNLSLGDKFSSLDVTQL